MGTGPYPGVKRPGRGVDHPTPSNAEVKERVELYLYSPSGPSWPVLGWTVPLPLPLPLPLPIPHRTSYSWSFTAGQRARIEIPFWQQSTYDGTLHMRAGISPQVNVGISTHECAWWWKPTAYQTRLAQRYHSKTHVFVKFSTANAIQTMVVWDFTPWSIRSLIGRFGGTYCFHLQGTWIWFRWAL